VFFLTN